LRANIYSTAGTQQAQANGGNDSPSVQHRHLAQPQVTYREREPGPRLRRKFKRFKQKPKGAREWLAYVIRTNPGLFAHWPLLYAGQLDTGSRMSREVHVRF
jgi:hypothetical protein